MSSTLRVTMMLVMLLAASAFGVIAYSMNQPQGHLPGPAPVTVSYIVAAHPLPAGTLAREDDFAYQAVPAGDLPVGAIIDSPEARIGLRGSLVRRWIDTGALVTSGDVLRPRDRGFLASVLEPGTRAISINVDAETGVAGLIWPGDHVDVVLTQDIQNPTHRTASETILQDARIIAIDQEIVQGAPANNTTAGKVARTVTLQLAPEQVERITVAGRLGKLSLAMRAAIQRLEDTAPTVVFGSDVSKAVGQESTIVKLIEPQAVKEYSFKR